MLVDDLSDFKYKGGSRDLENHKTNKFQNLVNIVIFSFLVKVTGL